MSGVIRSEKDIETMVYRDQEMMRALRVAERLNLPHWWIGAGFLRNKVWDVLSGGDSVQAADIDLAYFNKNDTTPETDWSYDKHLRSIDLGNEWEVRNQARMHYVNNLEPFHSTEDGIAHWVETATAVAVKLEYGELRFLYCYGSDDLLNMIARPAPHLRGGDLQIFYDRISKKKWQERWPALKVKDR